MNPVLSPRPLLFCIALSATTTLCGCASSGADSAPEVVRVQAGPTQEEILRAQELLEESTRLIDAGRFADAEALLTEAITLHPELGTAHNNLGLVHMKRGSLYEASWQFEIAMQIMDLHPAPRYNLGLVYEQTGQYTQAIRYYRDALELSPDDSRIIANLARSLEASDAPAAEIIQVLEELLLKEKRPEWLAWGRSLRSRLPISNQ